MSLIRLNRSFASKVLPKTRYFSSISPQEDEYTATPQYPQILDLSFKKKLERKKAALHNEIQTVKTVEEKQIKINMPRFYGIKSFMFLEEKIPYNSLPLAKYVTRTHLIENKDLPEYYNEVDVNNIQELAEDLQEALLMELDGIQRLYDLRNEDLTEIQRENIIGSRIAKQINRVLNNRLAHNHAHILNNEVDIDPRLESAWCVGGMDPPKRIKNFRHTVDFLKEYENDPIDRVFNYIGSPSLTVRAELPLPYVVSPSEAENPSLEIPFFKYDPRVLGYHTEHRHMANIPGFWPSDSHIFGLISFLKRGYMLERAQCHYGDEDMKEALHSQAILSSYAWLNSQANYLGFTTFNDITYPLVTQTVITNGKNFNFFLYQLNTILLHSEHAVQNPKRNICWTIDALELYNHVENGKLVGFNEEVLKILVKMYSKVPSERLGVNLRPYLSKEEKIIANYEDDDKRQWLEKEYKFLTANRPRHKEIDEIYAWEKIYKIDNKTRFVEKRRRFFELFKHPQKRTLDDRRPAYVPRVLRPDLPKNKGRRVKEYFP